MRKLGGERPVDAHRDLVLENSSTPRLHDFTTPDLHESTAMLLRYSMLPCLGVLSGHDLSTGGPGDPSSVGIHGSQSAKVRWASTGPKEPLTWSLRRISLTVTTLTWYFRTPELHESTAMRLHYSTTPRLHDSTNPRLHDSTTPRLQDQECPSAG